MTRTFPRHVDVAIVGSGPTGAAYARILSEESPTAVIATFEVGPQLAERPGLHVKNIADAAERSIAQQRSQGLVPSLVGAGVEEPDGPPRLVRPGTYLLDTGYRQVGQDGLPAAAMSSNVGGMGAHWTAACPRPGGSERIPFLTDLDTLLGEGERLLKVSTSAFAGAPMADEVRRRLSTVLDDGRPDDRRVGIMPLAVEIQDDGTATWAGSDVVYGDATRSNPNHTLFADALVTRVLVEGGSVRGVSVRDMLSGEEHTISARCVVVAGDSLRTPQLLWASGVRPDALGRYLNDQPQTVFAVRLRDVPATAAPMPSTGTAIIPQSGVSWVPFTDEEPFHGQVMQLDASPVALADDDEPAPGSIVGLGWFCAKDIQASDRVAFDDDRLDAYGMPAMTIHYQLTERDKNSIAAAGKAVRRAAEALGEPLNENPMTLPPGASLHYQGTVRMGEHPDGTSVCSPDSRVWDVTGLYVAGNGVIPTATACNPTLTSVALAIRGARDIVRGLHAERN
jgi:choline dehydrogenase-like flavoprotein